MFYMAGNHTVWPRPSEARPALLLVCLICWQALLTLPDPGSINQGDVFPSQTSEYIIQAYKYGAFEKIPEFIAFRNRLNNSLHFAQVRTERMLLDLLLEANM